MDTPICDFVQKYADEGALRLHMPGHKGISALGCEPYDITEIPGADSLYAADGIICRSERNAGILFGADTFYSTEGSSLCIKAMLYLAVLCRGEGEKRPVVYAGRNAHKSFLSAAALLDFDVQWLHGGQQEYLSCNVDPVQLDNVLGLAEEKPVAVYITSPDYLGNIADIGGISSVCHRHGVLLLVDNAHGAYLKFLPGSLHPIDLGADMCCDSAHKTMPVLTGGAYLHISGSAPESCADRAKDAMALFGSTSPSYLILQSLDRANRYIADRFGEKLVAFVPKVQELKKRLEAVGYSFVGDEPLKLTVSPKAYGYTGEQFAIELRRRNIVCEFADRDFVVLMLTPHMGDDILRAIDGAMSNIPRREHIHELAPGIPETRQVMTIRQAIFAQSELLPVRECSGRVLAAANVACPPAVPIVVCGEEINDDAIRCFEYYGIDRCSVVQ